MNANFPALGELHSGLKPHPVDTFKLSKDRTEDFTGMGPSCPMAGRRGGVVGGGNSGAQIAGEPQPVPRCRLAVGHVPARRERQPGGPAAGWAGHGRSSLCQGASQVRAANSSRTRHR